MAIDHSLRQRITSAIRDGLQPLPTVLAAWEGGSAAFGAIDNYSDIDLNVLVDDGATFDDLYSVAEESLGRVSPITASHLAPPGRYYKLKEGGDYLLVDLCIFRASDAAQALGVERHGCPRALFDKGDWLHARKVSEAAISDKRDAQLRELQTWFIVSQSFVRKAVLRGHEVEALASFWSYTLKPLTELLRMRYSPLRWDFGMRYLERDLPSGVYAELRELVFARDLAGIEASLPRAMSWGDALLRELNDQACAS